MEGGALLHSLEHFLTHKVSPAQLCQAFFVLAATGVLAVAATPESARRLMLEYGPRQQAKLPAAAAAAAAAAEADDATSKKAAAAATSLNSPSSSSSHFTKLVAWFTSVGKVPHSWFKHFYILSVCSSLFWAAQYMSDGAIITFMARTQAKSLRSSMTTNQAMLTWLLMLMQGCRRLFECFAILRPSTSKMWIVHWVLGMAYYSCINVSVWIEASASLLQTGRTTFDFERPSSNEVIGTLLFPGGMDNAI
ncbi:3-oxo-5-alpha-steroid 4-dehydrogenase [Apiospora phragmitis]|uniref:Polyprenal reductase n=1 Tax=Apiospora phragmitis TaxID=2905665 RepID=A0ABR1TUA2_9PEZI